MGRVVSHPHSITVTADNGRVTLSGPILTNEVEKMLICASSIPGVTGVENMLEPHEEAGDVPGLQGGHARHERSELLQENWSPAARVIAGATGGALLLYGAKHPKVLGAAAGVLGAGLIARSVTNSETIRGTRNRWRRSIEDVKGRGGRRKYYPLADAQSPQSARQITQLSPEPESEPNFPFV
jgi:BON domain